MFSEGKYSYNNYEYLMSFEILGRYLHNEKIIIGSDTTTRNKFKWNLIGDRKPAFIVN